MDQSEPSRIPALTEALQSPDSVRRFEAAYTLGRIGKADRFVGGVADPPVVALKHLLSDRNQRVRAAVSWALAMLREKDIQILGTLDSGLDAADEKVKQLAWEGIKQYTPASSASQEEVDFFKKHRPPSLVPKLVGILSDARLDTDFRISAAILVGHCGDASKLVITALSAALVDESADVKLCAAFAFSDLRFRNTPLQAFEIISDHLDDDKKIHRAGALQITLRCLEQLNEFPPCVIEALTRRLEEPRSEDRLAVAWLLSQAPGAPTARLEKILVDEAACAPKLHEHDSIRVFESLARLAPKSKMARQSLDEARPTLEHLMSRGCDKYVRDAAERILKDVYRESPNEEGRAKR